MGTYKDDIKFGEEDMHAMNQNDPNFDAMDENEPGWEASSWRPSATSTQSFKVAVANLSEFKRKVKLACEEYFDNDSTDEFAACVAELESPIFHQDIPAIVIKLALDKSEAQQKKINPLLNSMHKKNVISTHQMTQGFRKLYNAMGELLTDFPTAQTVITDFLAQVRVSGCIDPAEAGVMEKNFVAVSDLNASAAFSAGKKRISQMIDEYFRSEDLNDLKLSVRKLDPAVHFELVKKFISSALDQGQRQRELVSKFLAGLTGDVINKGEVVKAVTILLGRVEDTALDVPNVLELMSKFIARAVSDEALTPDFLKRVDLSEGDMGSRVLEQASALYSKPKAAQTLAGVWGFSEDEE